MCSHCDEMRHLIQRCYEIIDYLDWWDFSKKPRKNIRKPMVHLTKAYGSIDKYKARLVEKEYTQKYGVDYQETFAPVVKINIIQILIYIAVNRD